ncbi:putative protein-serine/threonine kinase [Helianthus debilis subsp. tardiflorus]
MIKSNRSKCIAIKKFKQSEDGDGVSPTALRLRSLNSLKTVLVFPHCYSRKLWSLLREISHENVVKLVNVHINHIDMSLYLAFSYAEHDLYVSILFTTINRATAFHHHHRTWRQSLRYIPDLPKSLCVVVKDPRVIDM